MLINDILDLSKIEAHKITLDTQDFRLLDLLQEVATLLGPLARQKNIGFDYSTTPGLAEYYHGDSYRICQILLNLAGNAIKFTEQGTVSITAMPSSVHEGMLRLEVHDTGIGIEEKSLGTIFDGFTQADSSTTRRFGGTGLGTTIARELTRLMGGHIGANSQLGKGSTFWVEIPLPEARLIRDEHEAYDAADHSTESPLPSLNILLAEDSDINALFLKTHLGQAGHQVEVVTDGKQALDKMRANNYDIVFMDMHMPVMDGIEATSQWRLEEGDQQRTPIIALTANVSDEDRLNCLEAGMDEFLTKPVSPEQLLSILKKFPRSTQTT
jgi:CheY-like chemotaxis protein/two-component sensor histidine kinase